MESLIRIKVVLNVHLFSYCGVTLFSSRPKNKKQNKCPLETEGDLNIWAPKSQSEKGKCLDVTAATAGEIQLPQMSNQSSSVKNYREF